MTELVSPAAPAFRGEAAAARYSALFCSLLWPRYPGHSGGEIRDFHLVQHLASLCQLEFFALHHLPGEEQQDPLAAHVHALHDPRTISLSRPDLLDPEPLPAKVLDRLVRRIRRARLPLLGPRYHFDVEEQLVNARTWTLGALAEAVRTRPPDFLFVSPQVNPVGLLLSPSPRTRTVLASYDVERVRMDRLAAAAHGLAALALRLEAARARRFEAENLRRFDGVIAVSELDRRIYVDEYGLPPERVLVVENGVDPAYFSYRPRRREGPPRVLYVGNLRYPPNAQAALRLLRRIMPRLWAQVPDAEVVVLGAGPPPELLAEKRDRVKVTGLVEDVRPYLADAWVGCFPLLAGSGTKYKVLEALSAGLPLVCSPLAAEGLALEHGSHLLVGEGDEDIAAGLARVIGDASLAGALAERGRAQVERHYAWSVNLPRVGAWLEWLRGAPAGRRQEP
ncbi:MAG: glycosyltransferase family 4 protein [Vicinamibacteria bacterium]